MTTDPSIYAEAIRCKELDKGQKSVPFQQARCLCRAVSHRVTYTLNLP